MSHPQRARDFSRRAVIYAGNLVNTKHIQRKDAGLEPGWRFRRALAAIAESDSKVSGVPEIDRPGPRSRFSSANSPCVGWRYRPAPGVQAWSPQIRQFHYGSSPHGDLT